MNFIDPKAESKPSLVESPVRVALIGCGAIAEQFHLPVLRGHDGLELVALVDRDEDRCARLARAYRVAGSFSDQSQLPVGGVDAAILSTPPSHHAPGAIALMQQGLHVLVEKPMALNAVEAQQMCDIAAANKVVLSVGLYKRLLPAVIFLKEILAKQLFGSVVRCEADWGGIGAYASATLSLMSKQSAGGGVLMDLGPHVLDILTYWFGTHASVAHYQDDSCGGIEADCVALLRFETERNPINVDLRLSRVRNLPSGFRIECDHAILELGMNERFEVQVRPSNGTPPFVMRPASAEIDASWYESYRTEIDDFVSAIQRRQDPVLSASSCLPVMLLIDECYRQRKPLCLPWIDASQFEANDRVRVKTRPRVLITGAGGFIGGRTAHLLTQQGEWDVRAHVRRPGSAARLARLPIEILQGDLTSDQDIQRLVRDCDAIVHCAVGTDYGQKRSIYRVTVDGTRRLVEAAIASGVKRFVHMSSIGVCDPTAHDVIDADTPLHHHKADWYGYTKGLAEQAVLRASGQELSSVILRPGCVYGPYGFTFVMNPLQALVDGRLVLAGAADTPSNTVFIDNLVEAIRLGLEADAATVNRKIVVIGDAENWTWGEYYDFFATRLGLSVRKVNAVSAQGKSRPRKPEAKRVGAALMSQESKEFAKRLLYTDPLGTAPRWMLERFPQSENWLRRQLKMDAPEIYTRNSTNGGGEVRVTPRRGRVTIRHAQETLNYVPLITTADALEQTYQWARYAGVIPMAESSA